MKPVIGKTRDLPTGIHTVITTCLRNNNLVKPVFAPPSFTDRNPHANYHMSSQQQSCETRDWKITPRSCGHPVQCSMKGPLGEKSRTFFVKTHVEVNPDTCDHKVRQMIANAYRNHLAHYRRYYGQYGISKETPSGALCWDDTCYHETEGRDDKIENLTQGSG